MAGPLWSAARSYPRKRYRNPEVGGYNHCAGSACRLGQVVANGNYARNMCRTLPRTWMLTLSPWGAVRWLGSLIVACRVPGRGEWRGDRVASGNRCEDVVKHVVADLTALCDSFFLVERPVDAEVDPALAILLLRFR